MSIPRLTVMALLCALVCAPALASPPKKKGKQGVPVWPVPNPAFQQKGFQPSNNIRQISGIFGPRLKWGGARYDHHEGFDFYAQFDPSNYPRAAHPVFAILPGVVTEVILPPAPERTETGRKVVITHDVPWTKYGGAKEWGNVQTAYLHLSSVSATKGQRVDAGDELGRAGESGYTSTVHLHLNCYRAGGRQVAVNPARLFTPKHFPGVVSPLVKQVVEIDWLERNVEAGTAIMRVLLPYNAYTLDGFAVIADKDASRAASFEYVSANMRQARDTGDRDLFEGLRIFPLRYNGGGTIDRVNATNRPADWPMATYPVEGGKGVRLGFDLLATGLPPKVKKIKLVVLGIHGEKLTFKAPGWRNLVK